jgi:hypothetical protein
MGWRRSGWTEIKCRASGWDGAVFLTFREGFRSPVKASAATRRLLIYIFQNKTVPICP